MTSAFVMEEIFMELSIRLTCCGAIKSEGLDRWREARDSEVSVDVKEEEEEGVEAGKYTGWEDEGEENDDEEKEERSVTMKERE